MAHEQQLPLLPRASPSIVIDSDMADSSIRVLSLNCWGLKYVAKHRTQRIRAIAEEIARLQYDIVGLQELWVLADFRHIQAKVSSRLPHSKFFYSGALGAGLALFSRYPIIGATCHPYSLNGSPIDVAAGDWFVGKAAASIVIEHPELGEVEVFNTHLFAKGGEDGPEHNRAHRLVNAWEFAKLARTAAEKGRYVIGTGDFNSIPTTLPMKVIRDHAGLTDAWDASHSSVATLSTVSVSEAIDHFGVTADSPLNSYSAGKALDATARKHQGKRLDYIFYRQPMQGFVGLPQLQCKASRVVMTERLPGLDVSFSDHFGLEAMLEIRIPSTTESHISATTLRPTMPAPSLSNESISTVLHALIACYRVSQARSRVQLTTFAGCIVILLGLTVGSAWLPRSWINPLLVLITIAVSWCGTTMLYVGFLYGNWEVRALTNVIEELELVKSYVQRQNRV